MVRTAARYLRGGQIVSLKGADPDLTLLDHLRLEQGVTGVKEGCNEGDCGACTVILARMRDGRLVHEAVNSCVLLAGQADGAEVITVEDLAPGGVLHPVQQALVRHHGSQCGFCTPGIVMSLFALYHEGARPPTRAAVTDQLAGNLCRCTGYRPIIEAALEVCGGAAQDRFGSEVAERSAALEHLADGADLFSGDEDRFFAAPAGVDSLARLYERHPDAVLIGGATDVGLWITKKLKELPKVIWLGRVNGLAGIEDRGGTLRIGAGTTLAQAAPALAGIDPDLGEVMRRFGSAQVRASGTVGGNIANGSPIGDLAPCLIALGATLCCKRARTRARCRSTPSSSAMAGRIAKRANSCARWRCRNWRRDRNSAPSSCQNASTRIFRPFWEPFASIVWAGRCAVRASPLAGWRQRPGGRPRRKPRWLAPRSTAGKLGTGAGGAGRRLPADRRHAGERRLSPRQRAGAASESAVRNRLCPAR